MIRFIPFQIYWNDWTKSVMQLFQYMVIIRLQEGLGHSQNFSRGIKVSGISTFALFISKHYIS